MNIEELQWHFDIPFWWTKPDGFYDVTPDVVLQNPEKHREEYERIMQANLDYPLDIMFWKNRWLLLDGLHRLVKTKKLGMKKLKYEKYLSIVSNS